MSAVPFDSHAAVKRLTASGFDERQAEALVETLAARQSDLVTKSDVRDMATKGDLAELRAATKADIAELRTATKADIAELGTATKADIAELGTATKADIAELRMAITADFAELRAATKADFAELRDEIGALENRFIKWMVALILPLYAALLAVLLTLFNTA